MKLLTLLVGVLVLLPATGWATTASTTDCDHESGAVGKLTRGMYKTTLCVNLCDTIVENDDGCDEFDFSSTSGMPDLIVFEYSEDASTCTVDPSITITTGPVTGGTPSYMLDDTSVVLSTSIDRVILDVSKAVPDRYLFTAVADAAGCVAGDHVDIRMYFLENYKP